MDRSPDRGKGNRALTSQIYVQNCFKLISLKLLI